MGARLRRFGAAAFAHLEAAGIAALGIGIARGVWLWSGGTLPAAYLGHGIAWNAGLAFGLALAALPAALLFTAVLRGTRWDAPARLGGLSGIAGAVVGFWTLDTALEWRDPATWAATLSSEARIWLPALALGAGLAWLLFARGPARAGHRRAAAAAAGLAALAAGLGMFGAARGGSDAAALELAPSARQRPPVFLVLVDTLRADHLSVYGYGKPTSPHLDALAADGVVHTRAFAPAAWTRPSCGSLLSSRLPPEIGLRGLRSRLRPEVPILPQFLRAEGYATAGIVSSVHISAQYGFDKGWDRLDIGTSYLRWTGVTRALRRLRLLPRSDTYPRYDAAELTDRAIAWLDDRPGDDEPPFLYLHYSDPHEPYAPPPEADRWREFAGQAARALPVPPSGPPRSGRVHSPAEAEALVARYDAEIAYFDHHFGRLLAALEQRGLYDDALVIVTSDHGEEFGEHGGFAHAHSLYNELLHVPLVIKYPAGASVAAGSEAEVTGLIDVVPTIRNVLGAAWPEAGFRGRSLLDGGDPRDRLLYADNAEPALRALTGRRDKLIQRLDASGGVVEERYYALDADFGERGAGTPPSSVPEARLRGFRETLAALYDPDAPVRDVAIDADTTEELRALGYLE
jgi:arylsulfatase A-like enzyme